MKKIALIAALALALPFAAVAQTTPAKPAAKAEAKPKAKKTPPKKKVARSAKKAVEEVTPIADDTNIVLTEADLAVAQRVSTGRAQ